MIIFKIGDKIISKCETSFGKKGVILEIASTRGEEFWCHGISGIFNYDKEELKKLKLEYKRGNFGVWFEELDNWELYKKKEKEVFGIVKFCKENYV